MGPQAIIGCSQYIATYSNVNKSCHEENGDWFESEWQRSIQNLRDYLGIATEHSDSANSRRSIDLDHLQLTSCLRGVAKPSLQPRGRSKSKLRRTSGEDFNSSMSHVKTCRSVCLVWSLLCRCYDLSLQEEWGIDRFLRDLEALRLRRTLATLGILRRAFGLLNHVETSSTVSN